MSFAIVLVKEDARWEALTEAERNFDAVVRWWTDLKARGVIRAGVELRPPSSAVTVSWKGGAAMVTDGPFLEAKETVGGFGILDVDTMEGAVEIVKTWPSQDLVRIEIRPVVD